MNFKQVTTAVWQRFFPIGISTLVVISLLQLGICQSLENLAYITLFRLRGPIPWSEQVTVVEIGQSGLSEFGYFFQSRQPYTALVKKLAGAEPAVIVLDVPFLKPSPEDEPLAAAIAQQGRVVLAQFWDSSGNLLPLNPALKQAAVSVGHTYTQADADGLVRAVAPQQQGIPTLEIAAVRVYASANRPVQPQTNQSNSQANSQLEWPNPTQPLWINWLGSAQTIRHYSYEAILQGQIPLQTFRHKIVLVGSGLTAWGILHTPFNYTVPSSDLYLHATLISNLLQQNFLQRPLQSELPFTLVLVGFGVSWGIGRWRFSYQLGIWVGLCLGWAGLSFFLFTHHIWLPTPTPMLWLGLTGGITVLVKLLGVHLLLRQSEERYALAAQGLNEGLWDWDLQSDRIYFSPRWKEMLGFTEIELGDNPQEWFGRVHPLDVAALRMAIANHLQGFAPHFEQEYRLLHRDGLYHWMLSRGLAVRDREGRAKRLVGAQADITRRKQAEEKLWRSAFYDGLTELPNWAGFTDHLRQAIAHAQKYTSSTFALLWLDLDQFKVVNNSLGNAIGDRLLVATAQRLKAFLSPENVVARLGGDEFAILMSRVQTVEDAIGMAKNVQQVIALPFNLGGHEVFITVSIGIALGSAYYSQPERLLRDADIAMHRAKAKGRAQHQVFDSTMRTGMLVKLRLENDLRRAIARGERIVNPADLESSFLTAFEEVETSQEAMLTSTLNEHPGLELYYQPIVRLTSRQIVGFEALVRWQHAEQGLLFPSRFISMAEETGLIIPLSWWVLRVACRQMHQWRTSFPNQSFLTMSVNLSSQQFSMPGLTEQIQQILQETELDAANLKLEMTEGMVMDNAPSVVEVLYQIRALGIQLAIDDFGTGYSSLSYLPRFPIHTLKIDRSFISKMGDSNDSLEIVRTILALAHNLGMDVTAEGVETWDQTSKLLEMQCEYGQGFFFSKPLDAKAATKLLKQQQA